MTIQKAYQNFMLDCELKNLSPETCRYYRENLTRFISWLNDKKVTMVKKLTKNTTNGYLLYLLQTVPNKTSINTYMRAVRRFVYYLAKLGEIKKFNISLVKTAESIKPTFSDEEIIKILNTVSTSDEISVAMLVLLSTGIRSRSLCEIRVPDVDFDDGYINIQQTKNRNPLRLPLPRDIVTVLKLFAAQNGRHDHLFLNFVGRKFTRKTLADRVNTRLRKLGIPPQKSGVHIFRHTFGRVMSINQCPTVVLQKWFGHSDIRITQRYIDLYGNDLKNTMNMLPTRDFIFS